MVLVVGSRKNCDQLNYLSQHQSQTSPHRNVSFLASDFASLARRTFLRKVPQATSNATKAAPEFVFAPELAVPSLTSLQACS